MCAQAYRGFESLTLRQSALDRRLDRLIIGMKITGQKIRRFVTRYNENGVATVMMDGKESCILQRQNRPAVTQTNPWQSDKSPADMECHDDSVTSLLILRPPKMDQFSVLSSLTQKNQNSLIRLMARLRLQKRALVPMLSKGCATYLCTGLTVWIMPWF